MKKIIETVRKKWAEYLLEIKRANSQAAFEVAVALVDFQNEILLLIEQELEN